MNITVASGANNANVWNKTMKRENSIKDLDYNIVSITSCEWIRMPESKD